MTVDQEVTAECHTPILCCELGVGVSVPEPVPYLTRDDPNISGECPVVMRKWSVHFPFTMVKHSSSTTIHGTLVKTS